RIVAQFVGPATHARLSVSLLPKLRPRGSPAPRRRHSRRFAPALINGGRRPPTGTGHGWGDLHAQGWTRGLLYGTAERRGHGRRAPRRPPRNPRSHRPSGFRLRLRAFLRFLPVFVAVLLFVQREQQSRPSGSKKEEGERESEEKRMHE